MSLDWFQIQKTNLPAFGRCAENTKGQDVKVKTTLNTPYVQEQGIGKMCS